MTHTFGVTFVLLTIGFFSGRAWDMGVTTKAQSNADTVKAIIEQQNNCIEHWAESVSRFDGTDAQRCEFMLSNRLVCLVGR